MKKLRFILSGLLCLLCACTSKQLYQMGQDINCEEFHEYEDPYYQQYCPKETYEEYQAKRAKMVKEK